MATIACTCPVCKQTGQYKARYAGKWHRCNAGCRAARPPTRLIIVQDGTGVLESELSDDTEFQAASAKGRRRRWLIFAAGLALVVGPWLLSLPKAVGIVLSGIGMGVTWWGADSAAHHAAPRA